MSSNWFLSEPIYILATSNGCFQHWPPCNTCHPQGHCLVDNSIMQSNFSLSCWKIQSDKLWKYHSLRFSPRSFWNDLFASSTKILIYSNNGNLCSKLWPFRPGPVPHALSMPLKLTNWLRERRWQDEGGSRQVTFLLSSQFLFSLISFALLCSKICNQRLK